MDFPTWSTPSTTAPVTVFKSLEHPGDASRRWTFARRLVQPLAFCCLPLMIGALVAVLQGYPVLAYLTVGFPSAIALALAWTFYRMQATPAEVHVRMGEAAVASVWACSGPPDRLAWGPIYELRMSTTTFTAGIGDAAYEFERASWPEIDELLSALRAAREFA